MSHPAVQPSNVLSDPTAPFSLHVPPGWSADRSGREGETTKTTKGDSHQIWHKWANQGTWHLLTCLALPRASAPTQRRFQPQTPRCLRYPRATAQGATAVDAMTQRLQLGLALRLVGPSLVLPVLTKHCPVPTPSTPPTPPRTAPTPSACRPRFPGPGHPARAGLRNPPGSRP